MRGVSASVRSGVLLWVVSLIGMAALCAGPSFSQNKDLPVAVVQEAMALKKAVNLFAAGKYPEALDTFKSIDSRDPAIELNVRMGELVTLMELAEQFKLKEMFEVALDSYAEADELLEKVASMDLSTLPDGATFINTRLFLTTYLRQLQRYIRINITDCFHALGVQEETSLSRRMEYFERSLDFCTFAQEDNAMDQINSCLILEANRQAKEKAFKESAASFQEIAEGANTVQTESAEIRAERLEHYQQVSDEWPAAVGEVEKAAEKFSMESTEQLLELLEEVFGK